MAITRRKLAELMFPWGSDFSYGKGSGSVGAVASFYVSDKVYPDPKVVAVAIAQVEKDAKLAHLGAHGWTKKDATELRKIARRLRYFYAHDYKVAANRTRFGERARPRDKRYAIHITGSWMPVLIYATSLAAARRRGEHYAHTPAYPGAVKRVELVR